MFSMCPVKLFEDILTNSNRLKVEKQALPRIVTEIGDEKDKDKDKKTKLKLKRAQSQRINLQAMDPLRKMIGTSGEDRHSGSKSPVTTRAKGDTPVPSGDVRENVDGDVSIF